VKSGADLRACAIPTPRATTSRVFPRREFCLTPWPNVHFLDCVTLAGRLRRSSTFRVKADLIFVPMTDALRELFSQHQEMTAVQMDTPHLYAGGCNGAK